MQSYPSVARVQKNLFRSFGTLQGAAIDSSDPNSHSNGDPRRKLERLAILEIIGSWNCAGILFLVIDS